MFLQVFLFEDNQNFFDFIKKTPGVLKILGFERVVRDANKPIVDVSKLREGDTSGIYSLGTLFYYPDTKSNPLSLGQVVVTKKTGFKCKVKSIIDSKTVELCGLNGNPIFISTTKDLIYARERSFGKTNL